MLDVLVTFHLFYPDLVVYFKLFICMVRACVRACVCVFLCSGYIIYHLSADCVACLTFCLFDVLSM